jgi:predicted GIY-YIG superfamily endonuclease
MSDRTFAGYVYVIQALCGNESGRYKIGRTNNVNRRIKQLSWTYKDVYKVIGVIYADNTQKLEAELHRKFEIKRVYPGTLVEWFYLDRNDLGELASMFVSHTCVGRVYGAVEGTNWLMYKWA